MCMNIILVGTGNVAAVLGKLFTDAGHCIMEIYGRNETMLQQIARTTGAQPKLNLTEINSEADVCLIAVSDNAIAEVAQQIKAGDMLVAHTGGATSKDILNRFTNSGVLYPLQSIRKEIHTIPPVPFFIDANTKTNLEALHQLASSTNNEVAIAGDEARLKLHLAAVLCSNFTNHLYALTQNFCEKEQISFQSLMPLITETAERVAWFPAAQMQTGPAIRHDGKTMEHHIQLLQSYPGLQNLYRQLSESIQNFSK